MEWAEESHEVTK